MSESGRPPGWIAVSYLLVISTVLLLAGQAAAQVRDPISMRVEQSRIEPGESVQVEGGGWDAGTQVEFSIAGRELGDALVGSNGYFDTVVHIPDLEDGEYQLTVRGLAEGERRTYSLTTEISDDFMRGAIAWLVLIGLGLLALLFGAWFFIFRPRAYRRTAT